MEVESRVVLCCGAKSWTLVIGWIQAVDSVLVFIHAMGQLANLTEASTKLQNSDVSLLTEQQVQGVIALKMSLAVYTITVSMMFLRLIMGIILIVGVKQKNSDKLKGWCGVETIFVALLFLSAVWRLVRSDYIYAALNIVVALLSIFFIRVVNIHRKEILLSADEGSGSGDATVSYYRRA